ncbi:MAG: polysaccharide pyruvyl transferase family protein [Acidobacteria bacterium]|nr:polysaccharide pyruvyl transferase family protein [Acidobacteriota bacterium]
MRILVHPGTSNFRNVGDTAMVQVCIRRVQELWPDAQLQVMTDDIDRLLQRVGKVIPVSASGRTLLFWERTLLGSVHRLLPQALSSVCSGLKNFFVLRSPALVATAFRVKYLVTRSAAPELRDLLRALRNADLVVVPGMAGINDNNLRWAPAMLRLFEFVLRRHIPIFMFGQGIGPLESPQLRQVVRKVLPNIKLVALREGRYGPALLESLGVDKDRAIVTGDDAIELAFEQRPALLGSGVGINLRIALSTGIDPSFVERLKPVLHAFARKHNAPLVPVPISVHPSGTNDVRSILALLADFDGTSDGGAGLDTPDLVIRQVGKCRIVVTGAYHAAVFALSQGIPAVCLQKTRYSALKFEGLADLFGTGCFIVPVDDPGFAQRLEWAIGKAWDDASQLRKSLLEAARHQVDLGRAAYLRAREILHERRLEPSNAMVPMSAEFEGNPH